MPHQRLRSLSWNWWRVLSTSEWTTAFIASAAVFLLTISFISTSNKSGSHFVPLTLSSIAQQKGAFCLDGTVPGFHLQPGFGSGSNSWLLHFEGGGWCRTIVSCSGRMKSPFGSTKYMEKQVHFSGILSNDPLENPDFFNWNIVKVRYCDGASLSGHPSSEFKNGTKLFFRGQLIWDAIIDELLLLGLSNAEQALLTGCSAGALAILIHCDSFRETLPKDASVKCLSDGGFFLNEKDIAGVPFIENYFRDVVHLQGVASSLNKDCLSKVESHKCFFPQEYISNIKTPIFLVNSAFDWWQIRNILVDDASNPNASWIRCKQKLRNCSPDQLKVLQDFREKLLGTLSEFRKNKEAGVFIDSCFVHCQTWKTKMWHSHVSPRINNKTIAESVGDWYFNRGEAKHIDSSLRCNHRI